MAYCPPNVRARVTVRVCVCVLAIQLALFSYKYKQCDIPQMNYVGLATDQSSLRIVYLVYT